MILPSQLIRAYPKYPGATFMITDTMKNLIGKKYYQLSRDEKLIVSEIFKIGRKHGFKLIVNLPPDADEDLKKSLQNGVWGIHEMEHKDAIGLIVQVEKI